MNEGIAQSGKQGTVSRPPRRMNRALATAPLAKRKRQSPSSQGKTRPAVLIGPDGGSDPTASPRDELILVDRRNRSVGHADKRTVHAKGLLHRAFSIFLVDVNGRLLLQRRNLAKYHSGGLWANSCCGHPSPGERTVTAAKRRLGEELGSIVPLKLAFLTRYHTTFPNGLQENEIVHVYFGRMPETLSPNRDEVMEVRLSALSELERDSLRTPEKYSFWLRHYLLNHLSEVDLGLKGVLR